MKKLLLAVLILSASYGVKAQNTGGFYNPTATKSTISTISEVLKMKDDTKVQLKGNIEKALGDEKYLFKDTTGTIIVEIDDEDWNGITVTPETTILVSGEIDKDLMKATEIDVDTITLAQ